MKPIAAKAKTNSNRHNDRLGLIVGLERDPSRVHKGSKRNNIKIILLPINTLEDAFV
jgi:hypothetical protein